ncbi:hypothetical protein BRC60_08205 [Halobacteriales archaeon QH_1_68_42]|nr:MAG: hypothetical protein BRC60_08205 [Halobacteriales archaeon QH_1_68_42]
MRRPTLHRLASLVSGALAAGGAYQLGIDVLLSGSLGLCVAGVALVLLRIRRAYPDRATGDTWADKRWTGLSVAVVNAVALLGLTMVPVDAEYRMALSVLVILVGLFGYGTGSMAEMERDRTRSERSDAVSADD